MTRRERIESILLGFLIGALGAWQAMTGLGLIRLDSNELKDPGMVVSGLMFFVAGTFSFFRGTLGSAGQDTAFYRWTNYLMILFILLGFAFIFFWTGIAESNFIIIFMGVVTSAAVLWFTIARWPGREKLQ